MVWAVPSARPAGEDVLQVVGATPNDIEGVGVQHGMVGEQGVPLLQQALELGNDRVEDLVVGACAANCAL